MFASARIKLTALYLTIIMLISFAFSAIIYKGVESELNRRFEVFERRLEVEEIRFRPGYIRIRQFLLDDLNDAKHRVLLFLVYVNLGILAFSGIAGFVLSGITLKPIQVAMDEQKRFVGDASHELRTPLTALRTSIEVALRDKKMRLGQAKKVLKGSLDDISRLEDLSTNLLELARHESGGKKAFEKIDLSEILERVYKKLKPLSLIKKIKMSLSTEKVFFMGDKEAIEKLISILTDNAIKYTPRGGKIWLSVVKEGRFARITVKDTGIGIAKKEIPHIFDRFYRTDSSRTRVETSGFGLGLAIAKKIVEEYKGSIDVKSELGQGSVFTVRLPL